MRIRQLFVLVVLLSLGISESEAKPRGPLPIKSLVRRSAGVPILSPRLAIGLNAQAHTEDHGNISVLHDDGTLVIPANVFDLNNTSLTFTPAGKGYTVQTVAPTYSNPTNNVQTAELGDDDSIGFNIGFTFPFYGVNYTSVYLNTNGNLTFGNANPGSYVYDLHTAMTGSPMIAPMFDDLVDYYGGGNGYIAVDFFSDHIIIYWDQVWEYSTSYPETFEVVLSKNGTIQFNYGANNLPNAVVGLSPGGASSSQLVDLSHLTTPVSANGVVAEVFANYADLDLPAIGQQFYQSHPDNYDGLMVFADFPIDLGAPTYAVPIRNGIQGGNNIFDQGVYWGSKSRLFIGGNGGSVAQYPGDPTQAFYGPFNALALIGQMFGHAWMSYIDTNPSSLLDGGNNWSFLMNALGSVMEGNEIQDLGNGQFQTINADYRYSPLDEYLMGLRAPANVPDWFIVNGPTLISAPSDFPCTASTFAANCPSEVGVQFSGTRQNVTMSSITSLFGARNPTTATSQKNFNVGFILVTQQGQAVNPQNLAHLDQMRQQWEPWFATATDNLGTVSTKLQSFAPTISSVTPSQGITIGGSLITITGTNLQLTSVVTIGGNVATVTSATSTSLQVGAPRTSTTGTVTLTVTNPDGQMATSSFTYATAAVSQFQVTLPPSGSTYTETAGLSATAQVGYGVINPATAVAIIRSFSGTALVSEASVPPTPSGTQWIMYAEKGSGGVSTGVAIANPGSAAANLTLTLSNGAHATLQIPAGGQHAAFIDELFSGTTLTTFLGTLTVQSDVPVSIVALRGTQNLEGQFIIATIPVSTGTPGTGGFQAFPIVTDGGGYNSELILVNSGTTTSSGSIGFSFSVATDLGTNSSFSFTIPAGGMWRIRTAGTPAAVTSGYAAMSVTAGSPTPSATAMIRLSSNGDLRSETAVPAQNQINHGLMFGSLETNRRTGIALLNPGAQPALVTLTPMDANGIPVGNPGTISVAPYANVSKFLDEFITTLPLGYEGAVLVQASSPIFAISLRGSTDSQNGFLVSTLPVIDLDHDYSGTYYLPQVVDGGGFTTQLMMMNSNNGNVQVQFFDTTGKPMALKLN